MHIFYDGSSSDIYIIHVYYMPIFNFQRGYTDCMAAVPPVEEYIYMYVHSIMFMWSSK